LASEGCGEIRGLTLLEQDHTDQKERNQNMKNDEDDNHREDKCLPEKSLDWCGGGDLNPYALRRKHLKLVRLPISPPPHWLCTAGPERAVSNPKVSITPHLIYGVGVGNQGCCDSSF
jgi:hypothetical protein